MKYITERLAETRSSNILTAACDLMPLNLEEIVHWDVLLHR